MIWQPAIIVTVQITLVAALGLLLASLFRSAAHRHSILGAALFCVVSSPLFYGIAASTGLFVQLPRFLAVSGESPEVVALPAMGIPVQKLPELSSMADISTALSTTGRSDFRMNRREVPNESAGMSTPSLKDVQVPTGRADVVVMTIWLLGTLFSIIGILRSLLKAQAILHGSSPVGDSIQGNVIGEASRKLGLHESVRVAATGKVAGPVVIGLLHPSILIPARYLETLARDELLHVLIHEGAHTLRRDPLRALVQRASCALFWWHPLVHWLNQELTRAREEVCDNFVLTHVQPVSYGATLLRLATLSPAMARFSLAIGMFDGRGKLEDRIHRLLDIRRPIMTRVRFFTAATVAMAFVFISVVVAASRVSAQSSRVAADFSPLVVPAVLETSKPETSNTIDPKQFRLSLTYQGESDKPFYNLALSVPLLAQRQEPFSLFEQISAAQAERIIAYLNASEFFKHAKAPPAPDDSPGAPHYVLGISIGNQQFEEKLGWDMGTLQRLDGIRKTLDGHAAEKMDQLLGRLAGQRTMWQQVTIVNQLDDADPVERLRPLVKKGWTFEASAQQNMKIQPGSNWGEIQGRAIRFIYNPPIYNGDGLILIWLSDVPAVEKKVSIHSSIPTSEYLGKLDRWHVYCLISEKALALWPTAKNDIKTKLSAKPAHDTKANATGKSTQDEQPIQVNQSTPLEPVAGVTGNTKDDEYLLIYDRYKSRILDAARARRIEEIKTLTDEFNQTLGGRLLFVQVVNRIGPIAEHKTVLSQFYGDRKLSIGKIHFAVATKPYVTQNANGEGYTLIATNPLADQKWPDDIQITLAVDPMIVGVGKQTSEAGLWSQMVNGLQARLLMERKEVVQGTTLLGVYLELRNVSEATEMLNVKFQLSSLNFVVVDANDKVVPQAQAIDYSGRVVGPWEVQLPSDRSQRLNVTSHGLGIKPKLESVLDLGPPFVWEFRNKETGPYYLKANLEVAKNPSPPADTGDWRGKIEIPKVRIPLAANGSLNQ